MMAGFESDISDFLTCGTDSIVGSLAGTLARSGISDQRSSQIRVWQEQVDLLKATLGRLVRNHPSLGSGHVILEYDIPRRQKRPDVIFLVGSAVIVVEFKFGARRHENSAKWQVEDYALNLRDFHSESHGRTIVPVLCATEAEHADGLARGDSTVWPVVLCNRRSFDTVVSELVVEFENSPQIDARQWRTSAYRPSLTIVEAAERLYGNHDVRGINHSYAANLIQTTRMLADRISWARENGKRCICFVTGVPGAGKTLTGLNVVHDPSIRQEHGRAGIFLSGNGPLVKIIREALVSNRRRNGERREQLEHEVSTFIQNIHQFLRYHRENSEAQPHERVVVFDEAQRAWNKEQMLRKQRVDSSEAALLLDVMERLEGWCVVIALVGGGQEIFLGEAGLAEWGRALRARGSRWEVVASPEVIRGGSSVAGHTLFEDGGPPAGLEVKEDTLAHLSVSVRSHRAQKIATWVNDLLAPDASAAVRNIPAAREFPLCVTRDLQTARCWLIERWNGEPQLRCGLISSSEDQRMRAYGIENSTAFRTGYAFTKWFLAGNEDVRSSYRLEVAASEFECQGLELDWVGVCWGGDLTFRDGTVSWDYRKFRGTKWQQCRSVIEQDYIRNRYRVLLTRARAGLAVWVPPGRADDPTLCPDRFDRVFRHLLTAGAENLDNANNR